MMMNKRWDGQVQVRTPGKTAKYIVVGSAAVTLLTFLCYRLHLDFASAISVYMLLVVLQSLTGNLVSAVVIAALSAGCLDFFFTEPLFSFRVNNPLDVLALLAFTVTALVITRLVSQVRSEAASSKLRKERLDRLFELSQQLLALEAEEAIGERFLTPFLRIFGLTAVSIFDADAAELHIIGDSRRELAQRTRETYIRGHESNDPDTQVTVRCLRVGGRMTGAIGFEDLPDGETADSLTALTAVFVARVHAFRRATADAAAAQTEVYRSAVLDALAHEFQTPLATILAAAGGIREAGPMATQQLELAETVENEAERLGRLTSRLLRTARLDREQIKPHMEPIEVTSLVANIASQYSARLSDRRIILTNPREAFEVLADIELLRLTLNQLIENACKYSRPGSSVTIDIEREDEFVATRVSNSGSSIPYEERHRVFERFYRGADAKRSTSGAGLGLYVARKIALAHGGALYLEADQRIGDNVTFCLKVPGARDELEQAIETK